MQGPFSTTTASASLPYLSLQDERTALRLADSPAWEGWRAVRWVSPLPLLVGTFAVALVARNWVITPLIPMAFPFSQGALYAGVFALPLALTLREVPRFEPEVLLMLMAFAIGSLNAEYREQSLQRWLGLAAAVAAVGPLLRSRTATTMRAAAWKMIGLGCIITAIASALWVVLPLPTTGWGIFSGISVHPKTLALDATIAVCLLVAWTTRANAPRTVPLTLVACAMIVMSGSRASVLTTLVCILLIAGIRGVRVERLVPGAVLMGALATLVSPLVMNPLESETAQYYRIKGLENSRDHLWAARLSEIEHFPLFGVGVGMAEVILPYTAMASQELATGDTYLSADGKVSIEPGSSWLAVFSMTGFLGGALFLVVLGRSSAILAHAGKEMDRRKLAELVAVMACFGLHMVEGGFVLSFGNPHCLYFWLLVGVLYDSRLLRGTRAVPSLHADSLNLH